jgi:hypothetical protein
MTQIPPTSQNNPNYNVYTGGAGQTGHVNNPGGDILNFLRTDGSGNANSDDLFDRNNNSLDTDTLNAATYKLDGLAKSAADIFTVMALMVQMSKEQREGARTVRDAERIAQQQELQNAADKMREAADKAFAAAVVSGVFKMASGAVSIGGGVYGMKQIGNAKADANTAFSQGKAQTADIPMDRLDLIRNQGRVFDGSGQMTTGLGDIIAAQFTKESTNLSADQKEAEAAAAEHETYAQREQDFMTNLQDLVKQITSLMQEIQQSNAESEKRAASV